MALSGISPPVMNWDSTNLPTTWEKFERHIKLIFAGPLKDKTEEEKVAFLLIWVGEKGQDVSQSWTLTNEEQKQLDTYFTKFKKHVQPKLNPVFARFQFNNERQGEDSIEQFVTRLKLKITECRYQENTVDEMIRDRIVFGISNQKLREKLINEGETLTLERAIQLSQNFEYCKQQMNILNARSPQDVNYVNSRGRGRGHGRRPEMPRAQNSPQNRRKEPTCGKCGTIHNQSDRRKCPAYGKQCIRCKKYNHWKIVCRSKKDVHQVTNNVSQMSVHDNSEEEDSWMDNYFLDTVSHTQSSAPDRAFVNLRIGPHFQNVSFKIDTGSSVNTLPKRHFEKLNVKSPLEASESNLTSYSGNKIQVDGKITLACKYRSKTVNTTFYIVSSDAPPLIGLQTSVDLGLIQLTYAIDREHGQPVNKEYVMSEYSDLFKGVGILPGKSKLYLREDAIPVITPPRRVPEALKSRLKAELDQMFKDEIISPVTEPTDWVHPIVVVEKPNGKLRICLDPKPLNDSIRRPNYAMSTLDDVTVKLAGATQFSLLDLTHAYWSVQLDEESSYLTTFATPFQRYRFLRLPYGCKASSDIFCQKVNEIFEGLSGIHPLVDDILIWGRTPEEHDKNLNQVLLRARERGIKFNAQKCSIGVKSVPFFGHVITDTGLMDDPKKIEAITQLQRPDCREKVETLLGLVNYLSKFAPNLAEVTAPIRSLLKKDVEFLWDAPQEQAFSKVKEIITQAPVLGYYDPKKPLVVETDASKYGLGCCLMQDGKPIAYASKSLTQTEIGYAVIEKELFGILFALKRFHQLTYGREVIVHCDHKPISAIMKKPLSAAPPRLSRMLLALSKYEVNVRHVPGKNIPVSDCLSRQSLPDTFPGMIDGLDYHVHTVQKQLHVTDKRLEIIRAETAKDPQMIKLKRAISQGWSESRSNCDPSIVEFHRDEISTEDGLIFRGHTLVIPKSMRNELVEKVHSSHLGITKTLERAKDSLFWPGMSKQVTDYVTTCPICLAHRDANASLPLITTEFPDRPFQKIATDLFHFHEKKNTY
ncbi:uncharacterized protein K02A2.6-like [Mya arenaria]|uniref:uncharacterized protein K02A2.6-like n=1 Tax=Mya arenaria TaxID=6604 RepID=UPI0022E7882A|nr:uncharacterized protein K02A2.6-like [Mya arenaria]XP_052778818.1 uncharacterized protein K02A2.6-like [Mya arenaria]